MCFRSHLFFSWKASSRGTHNFSSILFFFFLFHIVHSIYGEHFKRKHLLFLKYREIHSYNNHKLQSLYHEILVLNKAKYLCCSTDTVFFFLFLCMCVCVHEITTFCCLHFSMADDFWSTQTTHGITCSFKFQNFASTMRLI